MNNKKEAISIAQLTLEEKCSLLSGGTQFTTKAVERLGIPSVYFSDGPHGVRKQAGAADHLGLNPSLPATCYPTAATVANSWDVALAEQVGEYLGVEAAAQGVSVLLGPGLNIKRNPLCGRNFEYFSEDPYLSGKMAAAYVRGIQSKGIAACPKHFAVNSQETFRMASDSVIDARALYEMYLTAFEIVVKESKPKSLMSSYNKINGGYSNDSELLLDEILRKQWGFDGFVVTDWGGGNDRVQGLIAGNHLEMPATKGNSDRMVLAAVKAGIISEDLVNRRVEELLSVLQDIVIEKTSSFDIEAHHAFAQTAAEQSIVLLKNEENLLPLQVKTKVALVGPFAQTPRYQGAGSSLVNSTKVENLADTIEHARLHLVGCAQGCERTGEENIAMRQLALELAKTADVVVYCMGLDEIAESEGLDRSHMRLHQNQIELLHALRAVNENIVVVLSAGSPVEMDWETSAKAIVHGYLGGQAGAAAMLSVLVGDVNPSGKLTESYPVYYEDVPSAGMFPSHGPTSEYREGIYVGYRYYEKADVTVRYPFGYGLSYTSFDYSGLQISETEVSLTVKNTGNVDGAEVVQLYVSCCNEKLQAPVKELKGFSKVFLKLGESKTVTIPLDDKAFRYFNTVTNQFEVAGGNYHIHIGASSADIRLTSELAVTGTAAEIPSYFSGKTKRMTDEEFAQMLGHSIPSTDWDNSALIGRNDPIACLQHAKSGVARLVFRIINNKKIKAEQKGKPDLNILFIYNMPFRGIAKMMGGMVDMAMVDAMLTMVNGHFFKGVGQLIGAWRRMRHAQKEGITA